VRPVVEASAWVSHSAVDSKALILSNSGDRPSKVMVASTDFKQGTLLTDLDGNTVIYDPATPIEVKAFSYRALRTKPEGD